MVPDMVRHLPSRMRSDTPHPTRREASIRCGGRPSPGPEPGNPADQPGEHQEPEQGDPRPEGRGPGPEHLRSIVEGELQPALIRGRERPVRRPPDTGRLVPRDVERDPTDDEGQAQHGDRPRRPRLIARAPPSSGRRRRGARRRRARPTARRGTPSGRRPGRCRTAGGGRPASRPARRGPGARIGPPRPSRSTSISGSVAPTTTPKEPVDGPQRPARSRTDAMSGSGSPTTQPGVFQPRTVSTTTCATDRSPTSACCSVSASGFDVRASTNRPPPSGRRYGGRAPATPGPR